MFYTGEYFIVRLGRHSHKVLESREIVTPQFDHKLMVHVELFAMTDPSPDPCTSPPLAAASPSLLPSDVKCQCFFYSHNGNLFANFGQKNGINSRVKTCYKTINLTMRDVFNGCHSRIGMVGGRQQLSLGRGCNNHGIIIHEVGHALGLYHEQNRNDRDKYLKIIWDNILPSQRHNFKQQQTWATFLMTSFDYDSIMEYGSKSFSKNGLDTIEVLDKTKSIKEPYLKSGPTKKDTYIMNSLYGCQGYTRPTMAPMSAIICNFQQTVDDCHFRNESGASFDGKFHKVTKDGNSYYTTNGGNEFRLVSGAFPFISGHVCVSFKYKIDKPIRSSSITAYGANFGNSSDIGSKITDGWVLKKFSFTPNGHFSVYFEVTRGSGSFSVDDFVYENQQCR
ncbi:Zinc metalloproteinase nas-13 [Nymphon striatum]|nr:Zinc metalloproteinase nas-13 [Nymphon striatum]